MKVTVALCPRQMTWFEAIVAVGSGKTVTVTDPDAGCEHTGVPDVEMPTRV